MNLLIKGFILKLFAYNRGKIGYTPEEAALLSSWIDNTIEDYKIITSMLCGYNLPDVKDGRIYAVAREYFNAKKLIEDAYNDEEGV